VPELAPFMIGRFNIEPDLAEINDKLKLANARPDKKNISLSFART
jgi:hypothetical protein